MLTTPLIPRTRDAYRSVRERIEAAERTERGGDVAVSADLPDSAGSAATDAEDADAEDADAEAAGEDVAGEDVEGALEPDAWALDVEDTADSSEPGSGFSRRTDR